jgi:hypothetical protein
MSTIHANMKIGHPKDVDPHLIPMGEEGTATLEDATKTTTNMVTRMTMLSWGTTFSSSNILQVPTSCIGYLDLLG